MVIVSQSVTLPVPGLAEEGNSDTESHGEDESAAEICSAPYSSDSDTDSS